MAAPKEKPCNGGCGKNVHFNKNHPQGWVADGTPKGKWTPLEYGPAGEVVHQCPNRQQGAPAPQQTYAQAPAQQSYAQAPPAQNSGPSVTQLLLAEQQKTNTLLQGILSEVSGQLAILKALHPQEAAPATQQPPEVNEPTPADELPDS